MNLLFVCTGNTCRSCMAEAIAKDEAKKRNMDINIASAGIYAFPGQKASTNAVKAMMEMDLDLSCHTAAAINLELMKKSDLILTMTSSHKKELISLYSEFSNKIHTLMEYVGENGEVSDPFGGDIEIYRKCAAQLKGAMEKLFLKLKES